MRHFKIAGTKLLKYSLNVALKWNERGQCRHMHAMNMRTIGVYFWPWHGSRKPSIKAERKRVRRWNGRTLNGIHNRKWGSNPAGYRVIPAKFPCVPQLNKRKG